MDFPNIHRGKSPARGLIVGLPAISLLPFTVSFGELFKQDIVSVEPQPFNVFYFNVSCRIWGAAAVLDPP